MERSAAQEGSVSQLLRSPRYSVAACPTWQMAVRGVREGNLMTNMIVHANSLHIPLADKTVQCCVTSPPYWGLRDYGVDGQLGLEQTPDQYIEQMRSVFREVWRVMRDDGTLWLNIGDSYASNIKGSGGRSSMQESNAGSFYRTQAAFPRFEHGCKNKDLVGIPWMLAFALRSDGWYLRSDLIWHKTNPMPESVTDRPTKSHEYIFLLTKSERYFYDADAIKEPASPESAAHLLRGVSASHENINGAPDQTPHSMNQPRENRRSSRDSFKRNGKNGQPEKPQKRDEREEDTWDTGFRNKRSVWTIATKPYSGAVSYGSYRIASRDCRVHDYQSGLARALECDAQLGVSDFLRNLDTGDYLAQLQEGAVVSIPLYRNASLSDWSFAIPHSMRKNKTENELERDVIFYGISDSRTEYSKLVLRSVSTFFRNHESKSALDVWLDGLDFDLSAQTIFRIFGTVTFDSPPSGCSCYYTGKVEKRQDHFAVFPPALVEPCILAGSRPGDIVLDPFSGTGTTGLVAIQHRRRYVGIELNPAYIELQRARLVTQIGMF